MRAWRPRTDFQIASLSATSGAASASFRSQRADWLAIAAAAPLTGAPGSPNGVTAGRIASYGRSRARRVKPPHMRLARASVMLIGGTPGRASLGATTHAGEGG